MSDAEQPQDGPREIPAQRVPRDQAISEARRDYADRARAGDLAALLAPYHRP